jgi:quercetin dioxygenase-like cupin family protein
MTNDLVPFDLALEIADSKGETLATGRHAKTLLKKFDLRIVLISMDNAAVIKKHNADGARSRYLIRLTVIGKAHDLSSGNVLALGASIKHELQALEESALLFTVSWPDKLGQGTELAA